MAEENKRKVEANRRNVIYIALAVLLLGGFVYYRISNLEPRYQGKRLTEWLLKFDADGRKAETFSNKAPALADSVQAIQAIGTKGVPTLLDLLAAKDSSLPPSVERFLRRLGLNPGAGLDANRKRVLARHGFQVLGQSAQSTAPRLIQMLKTDTKSSKIQTFYCLLMIKPDKEILVPALMEFVGDRWLSQQAASELGSHYPEEAEQAGVYKKYPELKPVRHIDSTNAPVGK